MSWKRVAGFVATTDPLEAYGGIRLAEEALRSMHDQFVRGEVPMNGHHDSLLPIRTRNLVASLRPTERGGLGLWLEVDVHEEDWDRSGLARGWSYSAQEQIPPEEWPTPTQPVVSVTIAAGRFANADLIAALQLINRGFPVAGSRLFQFSALPPARIIVDMVWPVLTALGPNLAASAIWDGLKLLVLRFQVRKERARESGTGPVPIDKPIVEFHIAGGDFRAIAAVRTEDPDVLQKAMEVMSDSIKAAVAQLPPPPAENETRPPSIYLSYDDEGQGWKPPH